MYWVKIENNSVILICNVLALTAILIFADLAQIKISLIKTSHNTLILFYKPDAYNGFAETTLR